ncbi:MAG: endo alpha-1,4 polygalactosaminidase [Chloroflexi bacterium]|nr:endo alpha-1,4 polygalactosaminidase [Chloroflexota bacterium]
MKNWLKTAGVFIVLLSILTACQEEKPQLTTVDRSDTSLNQIQSWQIQYTGELDLEAGVDLINLDLFDSSVETIKEFHDRGVFVVCYFSAGTYENWRPDASQYPGKILGKDLKDWPGERWIDIRQIEILSPIIEKRFDLALQKGCDGIDPDNLDGFENDTGFSLTGGDQLNFNIYLSLAAHDRGLTIGLKNDLNQIPALVEHFDWIVNEECFSYQECDLLLPFLEAGKLVFVIEYELRPEKFCPQANQLGFLALQKNWDLDVFTVDCSQFQE